MDTIAGIRLFNRVVEDGSFSAAGRRLGLAPSSVSRQISALEKSLDARLLNRTTRKVSLTEAGAIYYQRTRRILTEIEEANEAVGVMRTAPQGTLKLSVPVVFGQRYIVPDMPEFLALYPEVSIELNVSDNYVDLIEEGADLAIRVGGGTQLSFVARKLATMHRLLCASPAYLEAHGEPAHPDDLVTHNCLSYSHRPGQVIWRFADDQGSYETRIDGNFSANNASSIAAAAIAGMGLALLPVWMVGREIQDGQLKAVLPGYRAEIADFANEVFAVYPHARHLSAKVRAYIDFIAEKFNAEPEFRIGE
ncbi:MAG: LysR family transcriptional regulator [Rhodospirillales bacterium]|nr:LysR family transcriptional regulator [Rhodospirillales bacterium]